MPMLKRQLKVVFLNLRILKQSTSKFHKIISLRNLVLSFGIGVSSHLANAIISHILGQMIIQLSPRDILSFLSNGAESIFDFFGTLDIFRFLGNHESHVILQ